MNIVLLLLVLNVFESSLTLRTSAYESNIVQYSDWDSLYNTKIKAIVPLLQNGEKSYYLGIHFKVTYFQAAQLCEEIHMKLVDIQSEEENTLIFKYVRDANKAVLFWTSGAKLFDGKHWVWMSSGKFVNYTNWAPGNPDSEVEHCLAVFYMKDVGLSWTDKDCLLQINFICQRALNESSSQYSSQTRNTWWNGINSDSLVSVNIPLFHTKDKSYFLGRYHKATFPEALQICQMMNMHLVAILTKDENERIYKYVRDTNAGDAFWTSGTRIIDGMSWIWMSRAQLVDYTNWSDGQPDSPTHNCIKLIAQKDKGLFWANAGCSLRLFYICEMPRGTDQNKKTYVSTDNYH